MSIKWERAEVIAALALVVALGSSAVSLLTYRAQFGEQLRIEFLPISERYIFPFTIRRNKGGEPYFEDVASWYKFRLSNTSSRAVSLGSIKFREDELDWKDLPLPLASELTIGETELKARSLVDLPVRIDVGESKDLFAFIPTSVSKRLGEYLFGLFREPGKLIETQIEAALLDPKYFDEYEDRILDKLKRDPLSQYFQFDRPSIPSISLTRPPFMRDDNGGWIFRDAGNRSKDGFRYRSALRTYNSVNSLILSSRSDTIVIQDSKTRKFEIAFYLTGGSVEYLTLYRSKMALDGLGTVRTDKIFR